MSRYWRAVLGAIATVTILAAIGLVPAGPGGVVLGVAVFLLWAAIMLGRPTRNDVDQ